MKKNPKILVIGQFPPPYHGSNVMAEIMMNSLINLGYSVCFIDKNFSKNINQIGKISVSKLFRITSLCVELIIKIFKFKPSMCIYFITVGKPAFIHDSICLYILRKCHVPYVLRFGGKGYCLLQKEGYFWKKIVKISLSNAIGGIVLGNNLRWDVISNIENNKLVLVPNCVPEPINSKCIIKDRKIRVLFLSNLIPTKGVMEVLKAAKIVLKEKEVYFTLAGAYSSKKFENEVREYIVKNNIEKFINLPGPVSGDIKANFLNNSDIFVFPTYYELETFGIVNVEAMSYGLPVISSHEGAISEIIEDGISGFLINPKSPEAIAEKIIFLAENEEMRKRMGNNGRKLYLQKYTLKAYGKYLQNAIEQFYNFIVNDRLNQGTDVRRK